MHEVTMPKLSDSMEVGKVGYTIGPAFAAVDHFKIDIIGKQAG